MISSEPKPSVSNGSQTPVKLLRSVGAFTCTGPLLHLSGANASLSGCFCFRAWPISKAKAMSTSHMWLHMWVTYVEASLRPALCWAPPGRPGQIRGEAGCPAPGAGAGPVADGAVRPVQLMAGGAALPARGWSHGGRTAPLPYRAGAQLHG